MKGTGLEEAEAGPVMGDGTLGRVFKLVILALSVFVSSAFAEDDYLQALEAEAQKIGPPPVVDAPGTVADSRSESDRGQFESELAKHKGTYSFYKKLLERDKAEVFKVYQEGASFSEIRRLIINRKLHR